MYYIIVNMDVLIINIKKHTYHVLIIKACVCVWGLRHVVEYKFVVRW